MATLRPARSAPPRHTTRSLFTHLALLATTLSAAPALTLQISNETAPPIGSAQFKISLTAPALISTAALSLTFDPTLFGPVSNVTAFTATGDQAGVAEVNGQQITIYASSASASLGQLPGLPVFVVTVPVLATAKVGTTSSITVDPTAAPWQDQQGNTYTVAVNPGTFTVGGTLSISSVTPGGGLLPVNTIVSINGSGFDAATTVTIDGVSIAQTNFFDPQKMIVLLGGATELDGKHVHVKNGAGEQTDFFCSLPAVPANVTSTIFPILPFTTYTNVTWQYVVEGYYSYAAALLNQTEYSVTVAYVFASSSNMVTIGPPIVIPPGQLYLLNPSSFTSDLGLLAMLSSAPIRMLEAQQVAPSGPARLFPPTVLSASLPPITSFLQPTAYPNAVSWNLQIGTAAPPPITVDLTGSLPFTVAISNAPWLAASAPTGTDPRKVTLTPNVSGLGAGSYAGTVTIHTVLPPTISALSVPDTVIPVSIQVSAMPFISATGTGYFTAAPGSTATQTGTINVSTGGTSAQFSVFVNAPWLTAVPLNGTTPGAITVTANPSGLAAGTYTGNIVIQGPANSVTIPEELVIVAPPVQPVPLSVNPTSLTFALAAGSPPPLGSQLVFVQPTFNFTIAVQTQSGGNWLTAVFEGGVAVNASAVGLNPGTYQGTITLTSPNNGSVQIPVTLVVLVPAAPLTVTPSSVNLTIQAGQSVTQTFMVTSSPSTLFTSPTFAPGLEAWVTGGFTSSPYTPSTVTVNMLVTQPGTHYGSVTFTSGSGSVIVPIVLNVTASATSPPILASVVNAASGLPSALSPGEIISLYGTGLGPQVTINNIAAPVIYSSTSQVNAIVPFEVSGAVTVQDWTMPLAPAAPGIFAIVNQDGSVNSPSNPAARGTEIQIFATGGGQTSPPSSTGMITPSAASLVLPVTAIIGGATAQVLYAGSAPDEIAGLIQINVVVPQTAASGDVQITIGGIASPVYLLTLPDPPPLTKSSTSPRVNRQ